MQYFTSTTKWNYICIPIAVGWDTALQLKTWNFYFQVGPLHTLHHWHSLWWWSGRWALGETWDWCVCLTCCKVALEWTGKELYVLYRIDLFGSFAVLVGWIGRWESIGSSNNLIPQSHFSSQCSQALSQAPSRPKHPKSSFRLRLLRLDLLGNSARLNRYANIATMFYLEEMEVGLGFIAGCKWMEWKVKAGKEMGIKDRTREWLTETFKKKNQAKIREYKWLAL